MIVIVVYVIMWALLLPLVLIWKLLQHHTVLRMVNKLINYKLSPAFALWIENINAQAQKIQSAWTKPRCFQQLCCNNLSRCWISLQDPSFAAFLLDKLQTLEWPLRGWVSQSSCEVCGTPHHHLRRQALRSALGLAFEDMPDLQPGPLSGLLPPCVASHSVISPHASWEWPTHNSQNLTRHPCGSISREKPQGMGWNQDGAARVGGKRTCLATVTPLPLHAQHYLEGVWRVTSTSEHLRSLVRVAIAWVVLELCCYS